MASLKQTQRQLRAAIVPTPAKSAELSMQDWHTSELGSKPYFGNVAEPLVATG